MCQLAAEVFSSHCLSVCLIGHGGEVLVNDGEFHLKFTFLKSTSTVNPHLVRTYTLRKYKNHQSKM